MKQLAVLAATALALAACGGSDSKSSAPTLNSAAAINTYLDGKTWVMTGNDIPAFPNGYSENVNFGAATQCYSKVTLSMAAGTWTTKSALGTLNGAPTAGSVGTCDRTTVSNTLTFSSTNVLIENVQGNATCFDVTVTYTGFAQEGRGKFSDDGKTLTLELYFSGQATGHRCANGAVGAATVTLNGAAFAGNAQQVYRLQ